jgi:hypothetical protein
LTAMFGLRAYKYLHKGSDGHIQIALFSFDMWDGNSLRVEGYKECGPACVRACARVSARACPMRFGFADMRTGSRCACVRVRVGGLLPGVRACVYAWVGCYQVCVRACTRGWVATRCACVRVRVGGLLPGDWCRTELRKGRPRWCRTELRKGRPPRGVIVDDVLVIRRVRVRVRGDELGPPPTRTLRDKRGHHRIHL